MERKRMLGALAGIGAAVILVGAAWSAASQSGGASPPPHGPGPDAGPGIMMPGLMPHGLLGHMADELGLAPEQRQTIKGFFDQAKPGFEQLHQQMRANAELLMKTQPDDPAYQGVVANVSQSAADLAARFVLQASQLRSQVHSVLTPEQRTKLVTLQAQMHSRMRQHRHHGPPAGTAPDGSAAGPQGPQ
jgi:Spy/CpxP family protein refolding chaperone